MAKKITIARPTKIELARLRRRHKLATRIQKIVKDRLSILIMEFLQAIRDSAAVKEHLIEDFEEAYKALSITSGFHGTPSINGELMAVEESLSLKAGTKNVAGVRIPFFEMEEVNLMTSKKKTTADSSSYLDQSAKLAKQCLERVIELSELEKSLDFLGMEINKVKRINNALEYIIIPGLDATIRYLTMKFEERDREEVARLKFVKLLIEQKEAHAF